MPQMTWPSWELLLILRDPDDGLGHDDDDDVPPPAAAEPPVENVAALATVETKA